MRTAAISKFEMGGLYLVAAYELHSGVSRGSDGIGANNPYYRYLLGLAQQCAQRPAARLVGLPGVCGGISGRGGRRFARL